MIPSRKFFQDVLINPFLPENVMYLTYMALQVPTINTIKYYPKTKEKGIWVKEAGLIIESLIRSSCGGAINV